MNEKVVKKRKLDIFRVLSEARKGNKLFFSKLTIEEKKAFSTLVIMRWMSGVSNKNISNQWYIWLVDKALNKDLWNLEPNATKGEEGHKELQWLLMCVVGDLISDMSNSRSFDRHQWVPMAKRETSTPLGELFRKVYPSINRQEINLLKEINSKEDIMNLTKKLGMQDSEINKIKKILK